MRSRYGAGDGLLGELAVSLASGLILAGGAKLLAVVALLPANGFVPTWLFASVVPVTALTAFFVTRRVGQRRQVFVVVSAFVPTRWLAVLLADLVRALDRHGLDVVVKLPEYDHSSQTEIRQLAALRAKRRAYLGGFVVVVEPERIRRELTDFCTASRLPIVFLDIRPFPSTDVYPPRTAFVGCSPEAIGRDAARWIGDELLERGVQQPRVLVVAGEAQTGRQARFASELRERLPSARIIVNTHGWFARDRAREIVDRQLRQLHRRGERLDAIYCTNDEMALGAADAVQEHAAAGSARDHVIIVGVDGIPEAIATIKSGGTPLEATIVQDTRRIAEVATDVLLRLRAGERPETEQWVPTAIYPIQ